MYKDKITIDNFRDMGGLKTADGKVFKEGKLFRTAALTAKTPADKYFIESLYLDTIIDFRTPTEVAEGPDYVPYGVEYVHASVLNSPEHQALVFSSAEKMKLLTASKEDMDKLKKIVSDTYRVMPFVTEPYSELFKRMDEGKTIAYHCTAGKDRTGIAALFIELNLGRNLFDAKYEYMLSNDYRADTNRKIYKLLKLCLAPKHAIEGCMYALNNHPDNFDLAIKTILEKYSSFEEFFLKEYDVTPERVALWKSYYLE